MQVVPANPIVNFLQGLAVVGITCLLLSLLGLFAVGPLLRKASKAGGGFKLAVVDGLCLAAMLGVLCKVVWDEFPAGDKVDGAVFVLVISLVSTLWWFVICVAMSRIGGISSAVRACYQLWVVPSAFLSPLFIFANAIEAYDGRTIRPLIYDVLPYIKIALYIAAFLACIPLTRWLVKRAEAVTERRPANPYIG